MSFSPPASARIELAIDASGRTVRRTTNSAAARARSAPRPCRARCFAICRRQASGQSRGTARAPAASLSSRSNSVTRPISRPSVPSTSLSSSAIWRSVPRNRDDRVGIGVGRGAKRRIVDRQRPHASAPPARRRPDRAPASARRDLVLRLRNRLRARGPRSGTSAIACSNRSRTGGNAATSSARRAISAVTRSMPLAVVRQPLR